MDALTLKNQIATILDGLIGTYTYQSGETDTAIVILPDPNNGYNFPPEGTTVSGMEVVIFQPYPDVLLIQGAAASINAWEIRLRMWTLSGSLNSATTTLINGLQTTLKNVLYRSSVVIDADPTKGELETVVVRFTEYLAEI